MPTYLAKPVSPLWQPGRAPAGCKFFALLNEGGGATIRDLSSRSGSGAFVGTPAWGRGLYGAQLGPFSSSAYGNLDVASGIVGTYPFWVAVLFASTTTTKSELISFANSGLTRYVIIRLNDTAPNQVTYNIQGSGSLVAPTAASAGANDGLPHVLHLVALSATSSALYKDGVSILSSGVANMGTAPACTSGGLGILKFGASLANALTSGSLITAAAGNGAVPDPMALAQGWLSGRFPAVRNPGTTLFYLGSAAAVAIAAFGTLAATPGPASLAATGTASPAPPSSATLAATAGPATFVAVASAAVPPPSAATLAGTAGAATFSATASAAVPPPSAAAFAGASGPATLSASVLASVPPPSAGTFSVTLASATFSASALASLLSTINPAIPTGIAGTIAVYAGDPDETQGTIGPYAGEPDPFDGTIQES